MRGRRRRVELRQPLPRSRAREPQRTSHPGQRRGRRQLAQRHVAVALGQAGAVGPEHERHVRVGRLRQPERPREPELARGGVGEVGAAHDLLDALLGVVDDHREVVGERAVAAPDHEVVDHALDPAQEPVLEPHGSAVRADAQRGRAPRRPLLRELRPAQAQARPGVGALGQRPVRRTRRLADLGPGAEALVQAAFRAQDPERLLVEPQPLRLHDDLAVPVHAHRGEIGQLPLGQPGPHASRVEVLHPHLEARPRRAREEPREHGGPQVPEVQDPGRAGGEAAGAHTANGSVSATSASRGAERSRSEYSSSNPVGHSIPTSGSSKRIPASVAPS